MCSVCCALNTINNKVLEIIWRKYCFFAKVFSIEEFKKFRQKPKKKLWKKLKDLILLKNEPCSLQTTIF